MARPAASSSPVQQAELIVRRRIIRFENGGAREMTLRSSQIARLQVQGPNREMRASVRGVASDRGLEHLDRFRRSSLLARNQSQVKPRFDVFGIERQRAFEGAARRGMVPAAELREAQRQGPSRIR